MADQPDSRTPGGANAPEQTGSEGGGAPSLKELLDSFGPSTATPPNAGGGQGGPAPSPTPGTRQEPQGDRLTTLVDAIDRIDQRLTQAEQKEQATAIQGDIDQAVETVAGELDGKFSKEAVEVALHGFASRNEAFNQAFLSRHQDPAKWQQVLKLVAPEIEKTFASASAEAAADREAVTAAVKGAKQATPAPADQSNFGNMTDAELNKWKMGQKSGSRGA